MTKGEGKEKDETGGRDKEIINDVVSEMIQDGIKKHIESARN